MFDKIRYKIAKKYLKKKGINLKDILERKLVYTASADRYFGKYVIYETGGDWYKDNYDAYLAQDLTDKYSSAVRGLDNHSRKIFDTIVNRLQCNRASGWAQMNFEMTEEEKTEIDKINDELYANIIKLSDDIYSYKGKVVPLSDFEPGVWFYHHFINELENLDKVRRGNIIDAGAYIGDSAIVLQDYTDCKVYSFEPSPTHIDLMNKTIELNKTTKIVPVMKGLGSSNQHLKMSAGIGMGNVASDSIRGGVDVEITTLDQYVNENKLDVSCIKVDIEGAETDFLKGAMNTIKTQKPALLLSIYHNARDLFEIKTMIESLNLGYRFKIRRAYDHSYIRDTMLICEV